MSKTILALALSGLLLLFGLPAQAQQARKIPWIGYLAGAGSGPSPSFIQGLGDLGYVEGKNIGIIYRTTEGRSERSADLADELVRLKVDIVVADASSLAPACQTLSRSHAC